jgi:Holliday junction resolvase
MSCWLGFTEPAACKLNSRAKGIRGELELAHWLESHGISAARGQQRAGGSDSPDVVHAIPGLHIECKRTERLELWAGLAQAAADCGNRTPTLWFRKNRWQWYVCLPAADFVVLLRKGMRI